MLSIEVTDTIFLGFCDRAYCNPNTGLWNIINLGSNIFCSILPAQINHKLMFLVLHKSLAHGVYSTTC